MACSHQHVKQHRMIGRQRENLLIARKESGPQRLVVRFVKVADQGGSEVVHIIAPPTAFKIHRANALIMEEIILPDQIGVNEPEGRRLRVKHAEDVVCALLHLLEEGSMRIREERLSAWYCIKRHPVEQVRPIEGSPHKRG